jgi:protein-L-isoaspartate(D-aspartate) O-methyltransferase
VRIVNGDGSCGWEQGAPFDAILAAASGSHVPQPLIDQLAPGGRLVMPLGGQLWAQKLVKITKLPDGRTERQSLGKVRFVPLIGENAWRR